MTSFGSHRRAIVMGIFSAITSPVFSELVLLLRVYEISHLPSEFVLFDTLRKVNKTSPFKLVFSLEVADSSMEEARQELVEALDRVAVSGLLYFLGSPPTIR